MDKNLIKLLNLKKIYNLLNFDLISEKLNYIRFKPFDTTTEEGVNNERYRKIVLSTLTSFIGKFISVFTALYSVPLTLSYLGPENYGLLMVITSINVLLIFSDLGLGNGLVNSISKNSANNNHEAIKYSISSVFYLLSMISLIILIIYLFMGNSSQWNSLFNIKNANYSSSIKTSIKIFIICFIINVPISVVYKVQMGFQEIFISNIWQAIGNLLGFLALIFFIKQHLSLPFLILALNGTPLVIAFINFINEFFFKRKLLRPQIKYFKYSVSLEIIGFGLIFTLINLANVLGSSVDNFIITNNSGPSSLINYSIVTKLFSILYVITYFSAPFWPAFSHALAQKNTNWARLAFKKILLVTTGITIIACFFLICFSKIIIHHWVGDKINPTMSLILGFVVFWIFSAMAQSAVNLLQSEKYIKMLLFFTLLYSVTSFFCKLFFVKSFGDLGVIWAGGISYGFLFAIPVTIYSFRVLKQN